MLFDVRNTLVVADSNEPKSMTFLASEISDLKVSGGAALLSQSGNFYYSEKLRHRFLHVLRPKKLYLECVTEELQEKGARILNIQSTVGKVGEPP